MLRTVVDFACRGVTVYERRVVAFVGVAVAVGVFVGFLIGEGATVGEAVGFLVGVGF